MKNTCLAFAAVILLTFGCGPKEKPHTVTLHIQMPAPAKAAKDAKDAKNAEDTKLILYRRHAINYDFVGLDTVALDSMGTGATTFALAAPVFAAFKIGDYTGGLFLSPGDDLHMMFDGTRATFSGEGAIANNYVAAWHGLKQTAATNAFFALPPALFLKREDSIMQSLAAAYQHYTDSVAMPDQLDTLFQKCDAMLDRLWRMNYALNALFSGQEANDLPPAIVHAADDLPYDSTLLALYNMEYIMALHLQEELRYYNAWHHNFTPAQRDSLLQYGVQRWHEELKAQPYPDNIKAFKMGKNLQHWLKDVGATPEVTEVYDEFKAAYDSTEVALAVDAQYNANKRLEPGKPAPEIVGFTAEGKKLLLSDLKGKVVYIDVWATWCGPCREEMPHAKTLMQHFEGNDRVAFLFVSVDDDVEAWQHMVAKEGLQGIHLNENVDATARGNIPTIATSYQVWGIPHYILIDAQGNIASPNAPRPSSGDKIVQEIERLLIGWHDKG